MSGKKEGVGYTLGPRVVQGPRRTSYVGTHVRTVGTVGAEAEGNRRCRTSPDVVPSRQEGPVSLILRRRRVVRTAGPGRRLCCGRRSSGPSPLCSFSTLSRSGSPASPSLPRKENPPCLTSPSLIHHRIFRGNPVNRRKVFTVILLHKIRGVMTTKHLWTDVVGICRSPHKTVFSLFAVQSTGSSLTTVKGSP